MKALLLFKLHKRTADKLFFISSSVRKDGEISSGYLTIYEDNIVLHHTFRNKDILHYNCLKSEEKLIAKYPHVKQDYVLLEVNFDKGINGSKSCKLISGKFIPISDQIISAGFTSNKQVAKLHLVYKTKSYPNIWLISDLSEVNSSFATVYKQDTTTLAMEKLL